MSRLHHPQGEKKEGDQCLPLLVTELRISLSGSSIYRLESMSTQIVNFKLEKQKMEYPAGDFPSSLLNRPPPKRSDY